MSRSSWPPTGHKPQSTSKTSPASMQAETKESAFEALLSAHLNLLPSVPTVRHLEASKWRARFKRAL